MPRFTAKITIFNLITEEHCVAILLAVMAESLAPVCVSMVIPSPIIPTVFTKYPLSPSSFTFCLDHVCGVKGTEEIQDVISKLNA